MTALRFTLGLVAVAALLVASRAACARVGVAPVVLTGDEDEALRGRVEDALVQELERLGHAVTAPGEIAPHLEEYDRSRELALDEWVTIARFLELDAVVVARMELAGGQLTLALRVVFPDGRRDESETSHLAPADAPYRAREIAAAIVGEAERPAISEPTDQQIAIREQIRLQEARHKRGLIVAAAVSPLVLAVGVGFGVYTMYRANQIIEQEKAEEEQAAWGLTEGGLIYLGGAVLVGLGCAGALASLIVGLVQMRHSERELGALKGQLRSDRGSAAERCSFALAPIMGPDGSVGAGAVIFF